MRQNRTISLLSGEAALWQPPKVFILFEAMQKIQCFVRLSAGEITGLGIVKRQGNNFIITDALILKQRVSAFSAEIDPDALNKFVASCENPSALKFQWHSHGNILAVFSGEDQKTIEGYFGDYMISLVVNKEGGYQCRLDLFEPFRACFNVPLMVAASADDAMLKFCRREISEKVEDGLFSKIQRSVRFRDPRFKKWDQEKSPLALSFEDLVGEAQE